MTKLIRCLFAAILFLSGIALAQEANRESEERQYLVGSTNVNTIVPKSVNIEYQSKLFPNKNVRIIAAGNGRMPCLYVNDQKIKLRSKILSSSQINFSDFLFEEFLMHLGASELPLKCQHLSFSISGHEIVKGGSYQKCGDQPWVVRLYGAPDRDKPDNIVYDSSISSELQKDGFWEEVRPDKVPK